MVKAEEFSRDKLIKLVEALEPIIDRKALVAASAGTHFQLSIDTLKKLLTTRKLTHKSISKVLEAVRCAVSELGDDTNNRKRLEHKIRIDFEGVELAELSSAQFRVAPVALDVTRVARVPSKTAEFIGDGANSQRLMDALASDHWRLQLSQGNWICATIPGSSATSWLQIEILVLRIETHLQVLPVVQKFIAYANEQRKQPLLVVAQGEQLALIDWRAAGIELHLGPFSQSTCLLKMPVERARQQIKVLAESYARERLRGEVGIGRFDVAGDVSLVIPHDSSAIIAEVLAHSSLEKNKRSWMIQQALAMLQKGNFPAQWFIEKFKMHDAPAAVAKTLHELLRRRKTGRVPEVSHEQLSLGSQVIHDMEFGDLTKPAPKIPFDQRATYGLARIAPLVPIELFVNHIDKLAHFGPRVESFEQRALFAGYSLRLLDHRRDCRIEDAARKFLQDVIPALRAKSPSSLRRVHWWAEHIGWFNLARMGHRDAVAFLQRELAEAIIVKTLVAIDCSYYAERLTGKPKPLALSITQEMKIGHDLELIIRDGGLAVIKRFRKNLNFHSDNPLAAAQFIEYFAQRSRRAEDMFAHIAA